MNLIRPVEQYIKDGEPGFDQKQTNDILILRPLKGIEISEEINMSNSIEKQWLAAHNKYRRELRLPALKWSESLERGARAWAKSLTEARAFKHSGVSGQGENLWIGTSNRFTPTQMIDSWGSEKRNFKYGKFPNVSRTGNWTDVGHYTQIIWRNTTEVGCAGFNGPDGKYRLVARYRAPGNFRGQAPY